MSSTQKTIKSCPRCGDPIPSAEHPGAYRGAVSRISEIVDVEVCSPCGSDESMRSVQIPMMQWPLEKRIAHEFVV